MDRSGWPVLRERFTELFKSRTRDEWSEVLEGSDACFAPVLTMSEAEEHPHIRARETIIERDGVTQPRPAPRFSRTAPEVRRAAPWPGQHTDEALGEWGFGADEVAALREAGALR
jgi:alpha-methylacyl-CoA racemase